MSQRVGQASPSQTLHKSQGGKGLAAFCEFTGSMVVRVPSRRQVHSPISCFQSVANAGVLTQRRPKNPSIETIHD